MLCCTSAFYALLHPTALDRPLPFRSRRCASRVRASPWYRRCRRRPRRRRVDGPTRDVYILQITQCLLSFGVHPTHLRPTSTLASRELDVQSVGGVNRRPRRHPALAVGMLGRVEFDIESTHEHGERDDGLEDGELFAHTLALTATEWELSLIHISEPTRPY